MAQERQRDAAAPTTAESSPTAPKIRWDDTNMKSAYANFCNVASTREEVVLLFGVNQAWHSGQQEIPIQLTNRLIVSPHAAKRLSILLDNVVKEYETRFGPLPVSR
ncbi:MAG TPA: DUF3467 domain-containing protein [Candidatus Methylomirabilis sp.]|nr:DUF3467 domain-containing protein [Candidatus Methylomirabilis sp.]